MSDNPEQSLSLINSLKCCGIVRTSCVTRIPPSDAATARTAGSILHAFRDNAQAQFEINFRFAKNTGDDVLIEIGVGEETDPLPYFGRASSRAWFSFLDKL